MFNLFDKKPMSYQNINAKEFAELKEKENHVVLDVRSPGELSEGAVPGHTQINLFDNNFVDKLSKLDKSKTYLVYCRGGNRSGKACKQMAGMGFKNLYNLQGGVGAWNTMVGIQ